MDSKNKVREQRMVQDFEKSLHRAESMLSSWMTQENRSLLFEISSREYVAIIPHIPFLGKRNPLEVFFQSTPGYLAVYRGMQKLGYSLEEAGCLVFEMGSQALQAIPAAARRMIGYFWFSSWLKERIKRRATETHLRTYPGNFVLDYVEGDGISFDYGVDYLECASCKYLEAEGAFELTPYICAVDKTASELLGWGLSRANTLAEGAPKCDFRFTKDGHTDINMPEALFEQLVARRG